MITVFIADDHTLIREGFKKILNEESDIKVIGETDNAFDIIDKLKASDCDILILDLNMPGKNGLDILKEIKIILPRQKVLILSMHPEERFAIRTLRAGASGYVTKESAAEDLVTAIRKVASGGRYISQVLAERLAVEFDSSQEKQLHETLSDREYQVLRLIAAGKSQSDIAIELSISPSTVNTYRTRVLEKLKIETNAELIRYAIKHGLID